MFVIDSSCWLEYFAKGPKLHACETWVEKATPENCACPTIVLYEVYKKLKRDFGTETADHANAIITANVAVVDLDGKIALDAADVSLRYNLAGADSIVKATANAFGATLVTLDHHFKGLENVQLL